MRETKLKVHIYGDSVLRKHSTLVKHVGTEERSLIQQMAEAMYAHGGIGLAAPQVGCTKQIIIVDVGNGLFSLVNPVIKKKEGSACMSEGCLSLPEVSVNVHRAKKIFVEGLDSFSNPISLWAEDLFARVIQHEMDHLKGKLIVDYASLIQKVKIKQQFQKKAKLASVS